MKRERKGKRRVRKCKRRRGGRSRRKRREKGGREIEAKVLFASALALGEK